MTLYFKKYVYKGRNGLRWNRYKIGGIDISSSINLIIIAYSRIGTVYKPDLRRVFV